MAHGFSDDKSKVNLTKHAYRGFASAGSIGLPSYMPTWVQQIELPGKGTYIIHARLKFLGKSGGVRRIYLTPLINAETWQNQCAGTGADYLSTTIIHKCNGTEDDSIIYLKAFQDSGATLTVTPSDFKYVRLYEDE